MKHAVVWAVLVLSASAAGSAALFERQSPEVVEGTWTARYGGGKGDAPDTTTIYLQFSYDTSDMGHTWPAASLPGLRLDQDADDIRMELRRDAGTIVLTGNVRKRRGFGIFDFTPNADFARQVGVGAGRRELTPQRLLALAVHDVGRAYIQQLEALGYRNLDLDQLLAMRIHRVTPEFIEQMRALGFGSLSHEDLVAFRIHGVTPDFIEEMAAVGYRNLSADRLLQFRIHGVDAEFVKDLQEQGFKELSAGDLVDARIHGRRWMRKRQ